MSPALLLPAALGTLAALLIPLVIHIARRTESRTIDFAALRWLSASPKPRRRLRLDERWLLAVRLLLLAALALWLAKPVLWGVVDRHPVVAIAPGIDDEAIVAAADPDDRLIWLSPGFPAVGGTAPVATTDLVSLIRQLDAELPPAIPMEVIVPAVLDGVDAERPRLSRQVTWQAMPQTSQRPKPVPIPPPALTVRYSAEAEDGVRYFRAAAASWTATGSRPAFEAAPVDLPVDTDARYLVWLATGPLPDPVIRWIRNGGTALLSRDVPSPLEGETRVAWQDAVGEPLAISGQFGRGRVIRLTRALEPAAIPSLVEPDFPDALAGILVPQPLPARVAAQDLTPLSGAAPYDQPPFDLRPWLALLIALIFGGERWLATRRRRAVAP